MKQITNSTIETMNLGKVSGGIATNIVMEEVIVEGEARSYSEEELENICSDLFSVCEKIAFENNALFKYENQREYNGFSIKKDSYILEIIKKSCEKIGLDYKEISIGGGSDVNVYNERGVNTVNLAIGMSKVHSCEEYIKLIDLVNLSNLLIQIVKV